MHRQSLHQLILVSHRTETSITQRLSHLAYLHAPHPRPVVSVETGNTGPGLPHVTLVSTHDSRLGARTRGPGAGFTVTSTLHRHVLPSQFVLHIYDSVIVSSDSERAYKGIFLA